jgi:hypothetical protein
MSVWRWIGLVLLLWAVPPLIARAARAISVNERRKRECRFLLDRVRALLAEEFPDTPVGRPGGLLSWFNEPELAFALATPGVFALVIPRGAVTNRDLQYVTSYGIRTGSRDLRIYVHEDNPVPARMVATEDKLVTIRALPDCPCGIGRDPALVADQAEKNDPKTAETA